MLYKCYITFCYHILQYEVQELILYCTAVNINVHNICILLRTNKIISVEKYGYRIRPINSPMVLYVIFLKYIKTIPIHKISKVQ